MTNKMEFKQFHLHFLYQWEYLQHEKSERLEEAN